MDFEMGCSTVGGHRAAAVCSAAGHRQQASIGRPTVLVEGSHTALISTNHYTGLFHFGLETVARSEIGLCDNHWS